MSDELDRLLRPEGSDESAGTEVTRIPEPATVAMERVPVEGGRVARRLEERLANARPKPKPRVSVVGVLGEILITAGVVVLMFLGWQVFINDTIEGNVQQNEAQELSQEWDKGEGAPAATEERPDPGAPIIATAPGNAVKFANLIIPRFGADYTRPIREGVGINDVLNVGIGHYPDTQMPGDVGNFAIAGHRTGWGAPLGEIVNLQVGDSIYIETEDGWYRYVYRSSEYVLPTGVNVLEPVPQLVGQAPTDRIITLTSCNPPLTAAERVIAYGVYDTWYPRSEGAPPEIAAIAQASAAG